LAKGKVKAVSDEPAIARCSKGSGREGRASPLSPQWRTGVPPGLSPALQGKDGSRQLSQPDIPGSCLAKMGVHNPTNHDSCCRNHRPSFRRLYRRLVARPAHGYGRLHRRPLEHHHGPQRKRLLLHRLDVRPVRGHFPPKNSARPARKDTRHGPLLRPSLVFYAAGRAAAARGPLERRPHAQRKRLLRYGLSAGPVRCHRRAKEHPGHALGIE
nr:hypothetical protein [Tanacetum cinerariifolium]